jgi:hypothetical protein
MKTAAERIKIIAIFLIEPPVILFGKIIGGKQTNFDL